MYGNSLLIWNFLLFFWGLALVLWIIALVQIGRAKATAVVTVLWVALVTLVPVLGAVAWFVVGRSSATR